MNKIRRTLLLFFIAFIAVTVATLSQEHKQHTAIAASQNLFTTKQLNVFPGKDNAPVTDLVVDGMEVTQSVQDLNNSMPLVLGKRTYVRVYAHSTSGTYPTTAVLRITIGAFHTDLLPIKPGGPFINVRQIYNRLIPSHAFLFEIPPFYTSFYAFTLTAEINPELNWHPHNPEEYSYTNNTISKNVSFDEMAPLYLVIASQPYTAANVKYAPSVYDEWSLASWIQRAYPINQLKVFFRTLPTINAVRYPTEDGDWILYDPECDTVDSYLAYNRASVLGNPFYPPNTVFYAMVTDTGGWMRGCAPIGGYLLDLYNRARVGSGPTGSGSYGWDFDGSYGDWYGGHEIGHAMGLSHTQGGPGYVKDGCGGEGGRIVLYPDGRISPTLAFSSPTAMFGFDYRQLYTGGNPVLSPFWHDTMTYCDYQWISGFNYFLLEEEFKNMLPSEQAVSPETANNQDVLAVFGSINNTTGQLTLRPISILFNQPDVVLPPPGDYAIVLRDADFNVLERYSFSTKSQDNGQSQYPGQETQYSYISELVPYVNGTTTVQIEGPSGNLAQVNAGIDPPVVQITSPVRGTVEEGSTITVTWQASDPDGDPLTFNVDYSTDDGNNWDTVGLFYTGTQAIIDQANFPASNLALVRVQASDGIHTTRAISESFIVPNHVPVGQIVQPENDITIAVSQTVTFEAQVYDPDIGNLDGTNIEWSSNLDGLIGNGATFGTESLSVGVHTITMTADDGQVGVITDQVTVTIVPTPNDLPPQPDSLTAGPDPVFLEPASGVTSATVYVDNLNLGHVISWSAVVDQTWLMLDTNSGATPEDLSVSADTSQLGFGTHIAHIIFTSPQVPGERVVLQVVVNIPHYALYLPVTVK